MEKNINKALLLKKFGLNVKIARLKKGWTQEQFAERLNKHLTHIGKIETGRMNMSLGKILELANALDIDINKLLYIELD
jgi:transcriptional regulator with XRE-family HTH domain